MNLTLIAAVGRNWAIGNKNQLIWKCAGDLKFFKDFTMGSILIMGRKTWDSLPRKPLGGRVNIVISSDTSLTDDAIVAKSPEHALKIARHNQSATGANIGVIGGEQIYRAFMKDATDLVLSVVEDSPEADTFFPKPDGLWGLIGIHGEFQTDCGKRVTVQHKRRKID